MNARSARRCSPRADGDGADGAVRGEPGDLSVPRASVFSKTDAGQFTINAQGPDGHPNRANRSVRRENRRPDPPTVEPKDLKMIVSNIGVVKTFPRFTPPTPATTRRPSRWPSTNRHRSAASNNGPSAERDGQRSFRTSARSLPSGSMVDAILNSGMPAPIDVPGQRARPGPDL